MMDALLQDVRYALRQMRRAPVLATAIVLTMGVGLGAAAAIFTSSEAALVEPLHTRRLTASSTCGSYGQELTNEARHHTRCSSTGVREPRASSASKATIPAFPSWGQGMRPGCCAARR